MISDIVLDKINQHIFGRHQLAFICVDHSRKVLDFSQNIDSYGFKDIEIGIDVTDVVDFLVGVDTQQNLELPMVDTPSGIPVVVNMLPDDHCMTVLMLNASTQRQYRSQLQQIANENELLVDKQKKLMDKLEVASVKLHEKNQQLKEANRLQTSFLSGVSHEFRTPLTSIIGYTDIVKKNLLNNQVDGELDNDLNAQYLRSASRSSKHLLSLVENLLDHGKLDSDEIIVRPKPIDLNEVFDDVDILLKPLCETKGIELNFESDIPPAISVLLDDSRLRQCLINLIGNAVKFTDHGSVTVASCWENDQLTVSIVDTGPGISKDDLNKIRLPFWQAEGTGKVGTGLGLTITDRIIELMGGSLSIDSVVGEGTNVSFNLFAGQVDVIVDEQVELKKANLNILLAEDDNDIADLVMMMLTERGVNVSHAKNGVAALKMIDSSDYDLVLMDLNMPVMNGYEAIEKLREKKSGIPVVVMSASALDDDHHPIKKIDCDAYLVKPVEVNDILQVASQFVN